MRLAEAFRQLARCSPRLPNLTMVAANKSKCVKIPLYLALNQIQNGGDEFVRGHRACGAPVRPKLDTTHA